MSCLFYTRIPIFQNPFGCCLFKSISHFFARKIILNFALVYLFQQVVKDMLILFISDSNIVFFSIYGNILLDAVLCYLCNFSLVVSKCISFWITKVSKWDYVRI